MLEVIETGMRFNDSFSKRLHQSYKNIFGETQYS